MFRVTNEAIDLSELVRYVTDPEAGAIVPFIGTTRNNNEGRCQNSDTTFTLG